MKLIKQSATIALLLASSTYTPASGIYLWIKTPDNEGLVLTEEKDVVDPDFIDELVGDGFSFEKNYDTNEHDVVQALSQAKSTSE